MYPLHFAFDIDGATQEIEPPTFGGSKLKKKTRLDFQRVASWNCHNCSVWKIYCLTIGIIGDYNPHEPIQRSTKLG